MARRPGIYLIKHETSGRLYVGSAQHMPRRIYEHRRFLRRGDHSSIQLQRAWNKHGETAFIFIEHEIVADPAERLVREQFWIDHFNAADGKHGYNSCPAAGTRLGSKQPDSYGVTMSAFHKGKPKSAAQRARMSASAKGKSKSPEHCANIAAAVSIQMQDPERRKRQAEYGRMAKPFWKGKKFSPDLLAKHRAIAVNRVRGTNGKFA